MKFFDSMVKCPFCPKTDHFTTNPTLFTIYLVNTINTNNYNLSLVKSNKQKNFEKLILTPLKDSFKKYENNEKYTK